MLALIPAAVIALIVGALAAVRWMRVQQRLGDDLREARNVARSLGQLLDGWAWRSDLRHRITRLQPPQNAPASAWPAEQLPADFTDVFTSAEPAALQARLDSAAPLDDIPVSFRIGGASRRMLLRAVPQTDATGGFAGYLGSARDPAVQPAHLGVVSETTSDVTAPATPPPASPASRSLPALPALPASPDTQAIADHEAFSFTVSHDLRAPIRVVEGFTKIVKEDYGQLLDRVGNDHLDRVLGAASRMNNMVDALLALSKLSSQPLANQPVNLSQLAGYVADDLRRQWPERGVQIDIAPDMQVLGDPTLLRVVVENLLGNAFKYTAKVEAARIQFTRHSETADTFTVADNGNGFDMRFADRLFGVFQRLHSANDFPGTGVGLASVRRIVRRHGGDIWGEGEVNRGARFHFSLPQESRAG